jgi:hypothetical protein
MLEKIEIALLRALENDARLSFAEARSRRCTAGTSISRNQSTTHAPTILPKIPAESRAVIRHKVAGSLKFLQLTH